MTASGTRKWAASARYQYRTVWQMLVQQHRRSGLGRRPTGVLPVAMLPRSARAYPHRSREYPSRSAASESSGTIRFTEQIAPWFSG